MVISIILGLLHAAVIIGLAPPKYKSWVVVELSSEPPWNEVFATESKSVWVERMTSLEPIDIMLVSDELNRRGDFPRDFLMHNLAAVTEMEFEER